VRVALNRWWHYFKRRALQRSIAAAEAAVVSAGVSLREAQLGLEEIARAPTPEFAGLSLPARRTINLAAIAYAEALCLRLTQLKAPMLKLAREATARRETADDYGSPRECVLLMGRSRAHTLYSSTAAVLRRKSGPAARGCSAWRATAMRPTPPRRRTLSR